VYTSEQRLAIAKHALEFGNASASKKYKINESTIRNFKKRFLQNPEKEIVNKPRTALLLGKYDDMVKDYIVKLRSAGGVVNRNIVLADAKGIIQHHEPRLLKINGGSLALDRSWAQSFLRFCQKKGHKGS
jgi:hypothetical protein